MSFWLRTHPCALPLQVAPNFCRVLSHFGVFDRLKAQAVRLEGANVRRYSDNEIINSTSFASLEKEFGAPTYVVHRADLHQALLDRALELGATLQTNVSCYGSKLSLSRKLTRIHNRPTSSVSTLTRRCSSCAGSPRFLPTSSSPQTESRRASARR